MQSKNMHVRFFLCKAHSVYMSLKPLCKVFPLVLHMNCNTVNVITLFESHAHTHAHTKWSLSQMPHTFCLVHMNLDILKFNWDFYVTCRWQEAYYSPSYTCCPPRSSTIKPCTQNQRVAWFACIICQFYVKCLVKREHFPQEKNAIIFSGTAGYVPYTAVLCRVWLLSVLLFLLDPGQWQAFSLQ